MPKYSPEDPLYVEIPDPDKPCPHCEEMFRSELGKEIHMANEH